VVNRFVEIGQPSFARPNARTQGEAETAHGTFALGIDGSLLVDVLDAA
jgi:hypothetical protein